MSSSLAPFAAAAVVAALRPLVTLLIIGWPVRIPLWLMAALAAAVGTIRVSMGHEVALTSSTLLTEIAAGLAVALPIAAALIAIRMAAGAAADAADEPALLPLLGALSGLAFTAADGPAQTLAALLTPPAHSLLHAPQVAQQLVAQAVPLALPLVSAVAIVALGQHVAERALAYRLPPVARLVTTALVCGSVLLLVSQVRIHLLSAFA